MKKIKIINGPNLNMLGNREPEVYGALTLDEIKKSTEKQILKKNIACTLDWYQSNIEGEIVTEIQKTSLAKYDALIINPAAYSHTSIAILDALRLLKIPIIEVHLTNIHGREEIRQTMLTAKAASIIMGGLGKNTYLVAVLATIEL
jgi:3-dehydroquinate dehydratase II